MSAKHWLKVLNGIAYEKVWSPDGTAEVGNDWVEIEHSCIAQVGWSWDGSVWTDTNPEAPEYARDRADAYPLIGDQLDALFHAGVFPEEMAAQLQAVKDQFPKE